MLPLVTVTSSLFNTGILSLIYIIDLLGTLVFAISGVMIAVKNKFDVIGALIIGLVTAVGGGTLRDVLIGQTPVGWMTDNNYLLVILTAMLLCFFFSDYIRKLRKGVFIFDTIGIAIFTILGLEKTLSVGLDPAMALLMGIVSACFGGVIRDVLCNEVPLIFRKEIYASACLVGGLTYLLIVRLTDEVAPQMIVPILVVLAIRYYAVRRHWQLPFSPL